MFFALLLLLPLASAASPAAPPTIPQLHSLARDPQWLKLLHARREAEGAAFFLSPEGRTNPEAELLADWQGFYEPAPGPGVPERPIAPDGKPWQHPQCRFPARLAWLKEALPELARDPQLPHPVCDRFQHFRDQLAARSISLVFSSYYLDNPSSAFGHSFLKLSKAPASAASLSNGASDAAAPTGSDLLDHGINYAAVTDTANALAYAFKGIVGWFPGTFTSMPYYYKVREYNDAESRDLWEYELNLTPGEIERLVAHLWELGPTYFDYFYFTENCSYHMLSVLEAASPRLNLVSRTPYIVIPVDTIRVLNSEPGLVRSIRYRPSIRSQLSARLGSIAENEIPTLIALTRAHDATAARGLPPERQVALLDAAADDIDFRYGKAIGRGEKEPGGWKQDLLIERSSIARPSPELRVTPPLRDAPHIGHGSRRFSLRQGTTSGSGGAFTELEQRFALQDFTDPDPGYPEYAELEMGKFSLRYLWARRELGLEEAEMFRITSLHAVSRLERAYSWRAIGTLMRLRDSLCERCLGVRLEAGAGYALALDPVRRSTLAYGFLDAGLDAASSFGGAHFQPGFGPRAGIRSSLSPAMHARLEATLKLRPLPTPQGKAWLAGAEAEWAYGWGEQNAAKARPASAGPAFGPEVYGARFSSGLRARFFPDALRPGWLSSSELSWRISAYY